MMHFVQSVTDFRASFSHPVDCTLSRNGDVDDHESPTNLLTWPNITHTSQETVFTQYIIAMINSSL